MHNPTSILITGASSGLGAALAHAYAGPGQTLRLTGRDEARLAAVADACRDAGAAVDTAILDVTDTAAVAAWCHAMDDAHPIDLVIANAGISAGTGGGGESDGQARAIFATNVDGVLNTVHPVLNRMLDRPPGAHPRGQIAVMSSLAGFVPASSAPAYCASKAAVRVYGESLRQAYAAQAIQVSTICPGYIRTPMTDVNDFPMPLLMEVDAAARRIRDGLANNRARIAFPWPLYAAARLYARLPDWATRALHHRLPAKRSFN